MTYCPECGSEVAPENTFCAYCGIALSPVETDAVEKNDELTTSDAELKSPETSLGNDEHPQFGENAQITDSAAEDLPPTLIGSDNYTLKKEWTDQLNSQTPDFRNDAVNESNINNLNLNSNEDTENSDKSAPADQGLIESSDLPVSNSDHSINEQQSNQSSAASLDQNLTDAQADELPAWDDFSINKKAPIVDDFSVPEQKPIDNFNEVRNPEFEMTIPYSPKDFASQDLVAAKLSAEKEDKTDKDIQDFSAPPPNSDKQEAIAKPEMPVGSSSHDSLEPRLVSVQIYNPNEQPETDASVKKESLYDSQTLLKHPANASKVEDSHQAKESRSYTSPNMGKEDTAGNSKAKLKPLDEGTVLNGRYEIIRKIGGGGMGAVYLASDRNLGGVLRAVKEMVQSYIEDTQQEKAINDFKRESLLLTSLEHPAIPTIYDYFYDEKECRFYLVMKYISGGDLAGRMRSAPEGRLDEETVTEWGIQIADVLDYLHNRQPPIVYRDLKPSNIMIDGNNGRVMLIDFGIARWVNKEEKGVTAVGTMGYAPPELFSGNVEPRSDIYSLGSTMFHLLTGADPQSNPLLIFDFNKNPRPRQINSTLSDQIELILLRMVEYNADRRFSAAKELREALEKHRDELKKGSVTHGVASSSSQTGFSAAPASNALVFCGFCGQKIVASDVFCPFCGAQQPTAGGAQAAQAYIAPKLTARIFVIGTNELDAPMFNLDKDTNLVGRRDPMSNIFPEVDLSKFDPQTKISRKHARIWRESGNFMVEDLGSSNGTVLITKSSEPLRLLKNQPHVLTNGDKIRVGDTTLHFVLG